MTVKIKLNLPLQRLASNRENIEVTGATVKHCLDDLIKQLPGSGPQVYLPDGSLALLLLLNNEPLPDQDVNHPVADNDEIWLLSIVSGG